MTYENYFLPNWRIEFEETSNNVFKITAQNKHGYSCTLTDSDFELALSKLKRDAFNIEQKVGDNRAKLFYDILINESKNNLVTFSSSKDNELDWEIEYKNRIVHFNFIDQTISILAKQSNFGGKSKTMIMVVQNLNFLYYDDLLFIKNIAEIQ